MSQSVGIIEVPRPAAINRPAPYAQIGVCERHLEHHCLTFLHWARQQAGSQVAPPAACPLCCREVVTHPKVRGAVEYFAALLREYVAKKLLDGFVAAWSPESEGLEGDVKIAYALLFAATLKNRDHRALVGDLLEKKYVTI